MRVQLNEWSLQHSRQMTVGFFVVAHVVWLLLVLLLLAIVRNRCALMDLHLRMISFDLMWPVHYSRFLFDEVFFSCAVRDSSENKILLKISTPPPSTFTFTTLVFFFCSLSWICCQCLHANDSFLSIDGITTQQQRQISTFCAFRLITHMPQMNLSSKLRQKLRASKKDKLIS